MTNFTLTSIFSTILGFTLLPVITFYAIPLIVLTRFWSKARDVYYTAIFGSLQSTFGKPIRRVRAKLFAKLAYSVGDKIQDMKLMEIGPGYGENFGYYPKNTNLTTLELNPVLKSIANQLEAKYPNVKIVDSVIGNAESMVNVRDSSLDIVVGTQILCCINDTQSALQEIRRVLKPGGQFYFLELTKFTNDDSHWLRLLQVS